MTQWDLEGWNERNRKTIEEFRANNGDMGGRPILLLTTTGAKSGRKHTTPLVYLRDGDHWAVFASKGGNAAHPDWYRNLVANKTVHIEVGPESFDTDAVVAGPAERDRLYAIQCEQMPIFAEYQQQTTRRIPVVIIEKKTSA